LRLYSKPVALAAFDQHGSDQRIVDLGDGPALAADQQLGAVIALPVRATDEGVKGLDAVHEPGPNEKIQRPVNCRWRRFLAITTQFIEYVIGLDRLVPTPDDLEYPVSDAGQTQTPRPAPCFSIPECVGYAPRVVVFSVFKSVCRWRLVHCQ
jgi:hypothetical protein